MQPAVPDDACFRLPMFTHSINRLTQQSDRSSNQQHLLTLCVAPKLERPKDVVVLPELERLGFGVCA